MTRGGGRRAWLELIEAIAIALLLSACGGNSSGTTPPPTTTPPPSSSGSCAVPLRTLASAPAAERHPKAESTANRRTRRGRVYEELWKHQAAGRQRRIAPFEVAPSSPREDVGQGAVIRDEGDLLLRANAFALRSIAVTFARNGSGGYDARRSDRAFQSSVGERIPLQDDDSARLAMPFTFPFYSGRYSEAFVNS